MSYKLGDLAQVGSKRCRGANIEKKKGSKLREDMEKFWWKVGVLAWMSFRVEEESEGSAEVIWSRWNPTTRVIEEEEWLRKVFLTKEADEFFKGCSLNRKVHEINDLVHFWLSTGEEVTLRLRMKGGEWTDLKLKSELEFDTLQMNYRFLELKWPTKWSQQKWAEIAFEMRKHREFCVAANENPLVAEPTVRNARGKRIEECTLNATTDESSEGINSNGEPPHELSSCL